MTTLTDTQRLVLDAARLRPNHVILPLPERLRGGAAHKVVDALIVKGLAEEREAGEGEPVWRESDDGYGVTLIATHAAMEAIGVQPEPVELETRAAPDAAKGAPEAAEAAEPDDTPPTAETASTPAPDAPRPRRTREGTKQALLIAMLRAEDGATIAEITAATGWQPHTVRGAFAGALKKRLGLEVASEKVDGRGRVYRINS